MGACLYHLLESGHGGSGQHYRFPAHLLLMEWGLTCGFQTLLQLLDPQHFHPFWGNVGLLRPILHLQNLLPGHW